MHERWLPEMPRSITARPYSSDQLLPFFRKRTCTHTQEYVCILSCQAGNVKTRFFLSIQYSKDPWCICVWFAGGDFNSKKSHRDILFNRMVNSLSLFPIICSCILYFCYQQHDNQLVMVSNYLSLRITVQLFWSFPHVCFYVKWQKSLSKFK